jgi:hypothetical protein
VRSSSKPHAGGTPRLATKAAPWERRREEVVSRAAKTMPITLEQDKEVDWEEER